MSFTLFFFILFIDAILFSLAVKTEIYLNIIVSIRKIIPQITAAFIILAPLFAVSLLISICNDLSLTPNEVIIIQTENEFKKFGLDFIFFSPLIILAFCFINQWFNSDKIPSEKKVDNNKLKIELKRLKISIFFANLALTILIIFTIIDIFFTKNNFPIRIFQYIKELNIEEINKNPNSAYTMYISHILFIIFLVIYFYIGLSILPKCFLEKIISYDNGFKNKRKYKMLIYIPYLNFHIVNILNKINFKEQPPQTEALPQEPSQ